MHEVAKQKCFAIFIDVEKISKTAWNHFSPKKLMHLNINGDCLAFLPNFLKNRSFTGKTNGVMASKHIQENSTRQGAIISPRLF